MAEEPLDRAQGALDRGDYGTALRLLEPLAGLHGPRTAIGGRLRLLMATALMGHGDGDQALKLCRSLRLCADPDLRLEGKALEMVLEAPVLERPRNWSLTLPSIGEVEALQGRVKGRSSGRQRARAELPPSPPVGPTKAPWGFAVVLGVLLLLAALLGGCMQVSTTVRFPAPGRLQLEQTFSSTTGQRLPWQDQFAQAIRGLAQRQVRRGGDLAVLSPVLCAEEAAAWLQESVMVAARLGGVALPPPVLSLQERNWLIGVRQQLLLELDLSTLRVWPGVELQVRFEPLALASVRRAQPLRPLAERDSGPGTKRGAVIWSLSSGSLNRLELSAWRWSRLGLGFVGIVLLLVLALVLQRLRWQAGFRLPELPA
ncbi:DUF3153 domain-containing protein [Cyanobium sp. Morenito 9A2]|uniref:DUF3153 domain-containing protein n=1 Tax=Cyanobium sp. Morenito 9A2 TaxID=2823718 RepID=UPI0020CBC816|nr:DUF3153 domain-containing protein [Cyanobium sp. Morenito 9A2]MCP9849347.1 DUF3153 domain-containing protein [Cyanobium sp. Morenito 9A2]